MPALPAKCGDLFRVELFFPGVESVTTGRNRVHRLGPAIMALDSPCREGGAIDRDLVDHAPEHADVVGRPADGERFRVRRQPYVRSRARLKQPIDVDPGPRVVVGRS